MPPHHPAHRSAFDRPSAERYLAHLQPGWRLVSDDKGRLRVRRRFRTKNFVKVRRKGFKFEQAQFTASSAPFLRPSFQTRKDGTIVPARALRRVVPDALASPQQYAPRTALNLPPPTHTHTLQGLELLQRFGAVAEEEGHHPDLAIEVGGGSSTLGCGPTLRDPSAGGRGQLRRSPPSPRPVVLTPAASRPPPPPPHPRCPRQGWNNITVSLWTHERGGLTENDFIVAAKLDEVDKAGLLSKKPPLDD